MDKDLLDLYNAREGTSQRTRLDENLLPDSFQIDGRTSADLVNFAIEFSKSLNYYKSDGSVIPGWEDFFIKDRYVFLYIIANTKLQQYQKSFYKAYEIVNNLTDNEDNSLNIKPLTLPIYELLDLLNSWKENLGFSDLAGDELIKTPNFKINKELSENRNKIRKIEERIHQNLNEEGKGKNENLKSDFRKIKKIFENIYSLLAGMIKQASDRIEQENASEQNVRPHMALYIGFLKTYGILQHRINGITKKHLDYYYEEVLRLTRMGKSPDETYVRFVLNDKYDSHFLEKGTAVSGGKDKLGSPIVYQTIYDVELTNTKIQGLYTLFVSENMLNYSGGIYNNETKLPFDRVTDIFFQKHDPENIESLKIFGEDQFFKGDSERTMETAQVGFIIASSHLHLAEGERKICVDFSGTNESYNSFKELILLINENKGKGKSEYPFTFDQIFRKAFDIFIVLDGAERKYEKYDLCSILDNPDNNGITLELVLEDDELPVTALKSNELQNQPDLSIPYIKVLLREESHIYAYPLVHKLDIVNIKLRLYVKGLKKLSLYNNYGQIDDANPFQLFGAVPKVNSYFLLGSSELFSKALKNIDLNLHWYQLPSCPGGWNGYFADYDEEILNSDYQVKMEYLNSGEWKQLKSKTILPLFEEDGEIGQKSNRLSGQTRFKKLELPVDPSESKDGENFTPYSLKTKGGYIKLELISPEFAFGYDAYQKNLYKAISYNAKLEKGGIPKEPNPQFSPIVKGISVNYTAEVEAISEKGAGDAIQLFGLGPFGYKKLELKSSQKPVKLLLDFYPEGHLFIGLDKYPKNGKINFFFNPDLSTLASDDREVPEPKWQYLENNNWENIPEDAFEIDNTRRFLQSGIISIKIPKSISNNNTLINDNLYWIKASLNKNSFIVPEVVGIHTNVQRVKWDEGSDGSHLKEQPTEYSISKMDRLDPKIVNVDQLLEPFNGQYDENEEGFYVRISERLRHKNRACTIWDYEKLLLERYPVIYKVKCFNGLDKNGTVKPGCLTIAVTPDIQSPLVSNQLEPKFGIKYLDDMKKYLKGLSSPFVEVNVINPSYEKIRVICEVKFTGRLNPNNYIPRLNRELIEYLTPWIYSEELDEQFGSSQYRSKIMTFVNQRSYVEFITAFSIVRTNIEQGAFSLKDTANPDNNPEEIQPEVPWSILTSVTKHDITVIDNNEYQKEVRREIGNMKIGVDFGIKKQ